MLQPDLQPDPFRNRSPTLKPVDPFQNRLTWFQVTYIYLARYLTLLWTNMSHTPRPGRYTSCLLQNKVSSLQLVNAGSYSDLWWVANWVIIQGNICKKNTSKSSARLSTLCIGSTEITGLCLATHAMCDPASQRGWPLSKQADQGFETGWAVL